MNSKKIGIYFLPFICLALLSSCSIQKRHYMPGYFVQNTRIEQERVEKENILVTSVPDVKRAMQKVTGGALLAKGRQILAEEVNTKDKVESNDIVKDAECSSSSVVTWKNKVPLIVSDNDPPQKDKLASLSFRFGIGASLLLLTIFTLYSGLLMLGLIFALLALVLGIIAWKRIKRNPDTRSGRWLALVAIIMGSFFILCLSWFFVFWGLYFNV